MVKPFHKELTLAIKCDILQGVQTKDTNETFQVDFDCCVGVPVPRLCVYGYKRPHAVLPGFGEWHRGNYHQPKSIPDHGASWQRPTKWFGGCGK